MAANLPTSSATGKAEVMDAPRAKLEAGIALAQRLMAAHRNREFLPRIYPSLFTLGIDEGSLHAYVLSAHVLIGERLGFTPVSDSPIFDRLDKLLTGEGEKRPDAVWLSRTAQDVRCLVEFERYTPHSLVLKARNLLVMGKEHQDTLELVVLDYWTYAPVPESSLLGAQRVFEQGFRHASGAGFLSLACPALVLETLVTDNVGRTSVAGVGPRLFVAMGENKSYVIEELA